MGILVLAVVEIGFSACFASPVQWEATGNQHNCLHEGSYINQLECITNFTGAGSYPSFILNRCLLSSRWCCADLWTPGCLENGISAEPAAKASLDGKQEVGHKQEQSLLEASFNGQFRQIFNSWFDGVRPHQFQHQITLSFETFLFHLLVLLNLIFPGSLISLLLPPSFHFKQGSSLNFL